MVGWMHYLGRGTPLDKQKGTKIIRDNQSDEFKLGEGECLAWWGYECKSDSPAACKFFDLCQLGSDRDWLCRYLMAVCVFLGFGTAEDRAMAVGIIEQLAKGSQSDCQFTIGRCFFYGWDVPEDYKKAIEWFRKSADQGNSYVGRAGQSIRAVLAR
ncbi:uncharacterized protein BJ171DRAFT_515917 [Polychytrium aggregatum]|uniref:uncharacterized protein n=1 Tax=Polychytrium aggregatum TaxID=110093 RepID=UPI0022FE408A|nr:uncharacterized protein BJ171DRAFT_515917 [Polychytrium aggregatum]KAI9201912.1 hypothetical protein BJ171DRAFT_515917 [Polychytrium aggregatum]